MKMYIMCILLLCNVSLMADIAAEYKNKCSNCHGAHARDKALKLSESIAGKNISILVKELKAYRSGTLNKKGMGGLMKAQVKRFTDSDIEKMARYLSSLPR